MMALRWSSAGVVVFLLLASGSDTTPWPILVLRPTNVAGVDSRTLQRAEREVSLVFTAAGVDTRWADEAFTDAVGPNPAVEIILLSEERSRAPIAKYGFKYDHLGYVVRPELRAYVFWWHVRETSFHFSRDVGEVLGLVIAHEVGHLLLPRADHSSSGIMRASFDLSVRWPQRFTRAEAALIRAALAAHPSPLLEEPGDGDSPAPPR